MTNGFGKNTEKYEIVGLLETAEAETANSHDSN
jgi:hypothetical protein